MSLLTVVQYFCGRNNLPVPSTVVGNSNGAVLQILRLLEEEGNDLALRGSWNVLTLQASHTTTAAEDQGAITTIAPTSYRFIVNDTIWDRSGKLPVFPVDGPDWQAIKATVSSVSPYRYRLRGGNLLVTPTPTAGLSWYFEYMSKAWILNGASTKVQYFVADADVMLLPEELIMQGLRWRYMREKGLEYAELFATYEKQVETYLSKERPRPRLNMSPEMSNSPGVYVPAGSWISP